MERQLGFVRFGSVLATFATASLAFVACNPATRSDAPPLPTLPADATARFTASQATEFSRLKDRLSLATTQQEEASVLLDLAAFLQVTVEFFDDAKAHYDAGLARLDADTEERARGSYFAARLNTQLGDVEAALELFESVRQSGGYPPASLMEAGLLIDAGEPEAAIALVEALLDHPAYAVPASSTIARAQTALGNSDAAADLLRAALLKAPDSPALRYQLARLERDRGRTVRARDLLAGVKAPTSKALTVPVPDPWLAELEARFASPAVHLLRAQQLMAIKAPNSSIRREFETGLAKPESAGLRRAFVRWLLDQGELRTANAVAADGLDPADPSDADLLALYVESLIATGRLTEASAALSQVSSGDENATSFALLADLLRLQTSGCADPARGRNKDGSSALWSWLCSEPSAMQDREATSVWEKAAKARWLATRPQPTAAQQADLLELRTALRAQPQQTVYYVESLAMVEAALTDTRRASRWQQLVVEALEQSPAACGVELATQRLARYRSGKPARSHWGSEERFCLLEIVRQ